MEGESCTWLPLMILSHPWSTYLVFARGGDVHSVRMGWVFGSSNSVCLFQVISLYSCTRFSSIRVGLVETGREKIKMKH